MDPLYLSIANCFVAQTGPLLIFWRCAVLVCANGTYAYARQLTNFPTQPITFFSTLSGPKQNNFKFLFRLALKTQRYFFLHSFLIHTPSPLPSITSPSLPSTSSSIQHIHINGASACREPEQLDANNGPAVRPTRQQWCQRLVPRLLRARQGRGRRRRLGHLRVHG